jgi:hypothetical protein
MFLFPLSIGHGAGDAPANSAAPSAQADHATSARRPPPTLSTEYPGGSLSLPALARVRLLDCSRVPGGRAVRLGIPLSFFQRAKRLPEIGADIAPDWVRRTSFRHCGPTSGGTSATADIMRTMVAPMAGRVPGGASSIETPVRGSLRLSPRWHRRSASRQNG